VTLGDITFLDTVGYYTTQTKTTFADYLATYVSPNNLILEGPGRGDYYIEFDPNPTNVWEYNHNVDEMAAYVNQGKSSAMFAWIWQDEPNMGGSGDRVYMPVIGAWSYIGHHGNGTYTGDANHPSFNGFEGGDKLIDDYLGDYPLMGKKWLQDIFSYDTYPIKYWLWPHQNNATYGTYAIYLTQLDTYISNNKGLVPIIPSINPGADDGFVYASGDGAVSHTSAMVYMEMWMNVIHGAKGELLFCNDNTSATIRWDAIKKFNDEMAGTNGYSPALTPIVLGPAPVRTVTRTDQANTDLAPTPNRVDTMIREPGDGYIYIIAARITEPDWITGALYTGEEPTTITPSFTISGISSAVTAAVYSESRNVSVSASGVFSDTFNKWDVHIYKIPVSGGGTYYLPWISE
jgi:hypothetical protein